MSTNSTPPHNEAVERCNRAWQRAFNKESNDGSNDYDAEKAANRAYLCAMPPLSGYQNVCDFIACVAHAVVIDAIFKADAERLLAAAKIAVTALRQEPKPPGSGPSKTPQGAKV